MDKILTGKMPLVMQKSYNCIKNHNLSDTGDKLENTCHFSPAAAPIFSKKYIHPQKNGAGLTQPFISTKESFL